MVRLIIYMREGVRIYDTLGVSNNFPSLYNRCYWFVNALLYTSVKKLTKVDEITNNTHF